MMRVVLLVVALVLASCQKTKPVEVLASSSVKVIVGDGHGSGTYIGNGYIVTASHVVDNQSSIEIKTDRGDTVKAELLWSASAYDVALLRVEGLKAQRSYVNCHPLESGTQIVARGNPLDQDFVSTWGHISGPASPTGLPIKSLVVADITITNGMSGGGIFNQAGQLVGTITAVMMNKFSQIGIAFIVPSSTFCALVPALAHV